MKTNPTCERADCPKTFSDSLNFCQLCGATLVAKQDESQVSDFDPYKTVVAVAPPKIEEFKQEGVSDIPAYDPLKTVVASSSTPISEPVKEDIPSPFNNPLPPLKEESVNPFDNNFNQPSFNEAPLPSESTPIDSWNQPNPFDPQPQSYEQQPFPPTPSFKEPESPFGSQAANDAFSNNQWTPPPAPVQNWENQGINQNTPFNPPPVAQGQNQTLAIVSLVMGILSVCCYIGWATGPIAFILGFMHRKKVKENPMEYGGDGLALAGMIVGAIFGVIWILYFIFIFLVYAGLIGSALISR